MNSKISKSKITWNSESSTRELLLRFLNLFKPPERIGRDEWAEKHRRLSPESSSKPGKFSFDLAPWQRHVLKWVDDPSVGGIVLQWASQITGKTETINNIIGYSIDIDPCPILLLQPTLEMASTWSKDRLSPMLRDTPRLRGKVKEARTRDSGNTILHKRFPGGHITIAGANSPASLASRPIRIVICDEEDRYPISAGTEGDPVTLAEKRMESFPDAILIEVSSPTIAGVSRIEKRIAVSDAQRWFITHKCGHEYYFDKEQFKFDESNPVDAWLECPKCQARIYDDERRDMVKSGTPKPTRPFNGVRGFVLPGINTLFKARKPYKNQLHKLAVESLNARVKGEAAEKVLENTYWARTWEEKAEQVEWSPLLERAEPYGPALPDEVWLLTATVDIQQDRAEIEVLGWGDEEETWGIQRYVVHGDFDLPDTQEKIDEYLSRKWKHPAGLELGITAVGIDTGHKTKAAYKFCKARVARRFYPMKGSSTAGSPLVTPRQHKHYRLVLFSIGTDTAKDSIFSRLRIDEPGPRYMHFPQSVIEYEENGEQKKHRSGYNADYFKQLCSEKLVTTIEKGQVRRKWKKQFERNEALDLRVYNLGAYDILKPNIPKIRENLLASIGKPVSTPKEYSLRTEKPVTSPEQPKPAAKPVPPRRTIRMGGLRGGKWL